MFANLSGKLSAVFKQLKGEARITKENIAAALKDVRMALLEADVNYKVVKSFLAKVEVRALGQDVLSSVSPAQQFVKIVNDELTSTLGGSDYTPKIRLSSVPPTVILMAGLQGSGKTTSCGKLAKYFIKAGKSVTLVACDIYRPAAVKQLEVVAELAGASFYSEDSRDAAQIALNGVTFAKKAASDIVVIDTAGRLHIDEEMMSEAEAVKRAVSPNEILYSGDAMSGQDAVQSAAEFNKRLSLTGVILTKTDGDARGGAALSIREVTGVPLLFIGTGEKLEEFELFHPSRMAGRILGMGDIVTLVERAQEAIDLDEIDPAEMTKKLVKTGMDFEDMLKQFKMLKKMGSFSGLLKMVPGLNKMLPKEMGEADLDDKRFKHAEAVILSMTPLERRKPEVINSSRKKRIAMGAGRSVTEVNRLLDQLRETNKMVKKMAKGGLGNFGGMFR